MIFYNYGEIITIQLTGFLNLKPVNWNFVKNRLIFRLSGFGSQPYSIACVLHNSESEIHLYLIKRGMADPTKILYYIWCEQEPIARRVIAKELDYPLQSTF